MIDRVGCRIAHAAGNRLVVEALHVLHGEFASRDVGTYLLDYAVMIHQGFGDPAIKRWLRQIPQADFLRAPFAADVVQGAMKLSIGIKFWFFSRCHTFTRFAVRCRPRYVRESARPVLLSPYSVTGTGW